MLPKGEYNSGGNKRLYVLKQPATVSWGGGGGGGVVGGQSPTWRSNYEEALTLSQQNLQIFNPFFQYHQ